MAKKQESLTLCLFNRYPDSPSEPWLWYILHQVIALSIQWWLRPLFLFYTTAETLPKDSRNTPEIVNPPSPDRPLHSQTSSSCYYPAVLKGPRIRMPSYPSTQRSPGSRPLPSAGISRAVDFHFGGWVVCFGNVFGLVCVSSGFIQNVVFRFLFLEEIVKWQ